MYTLLWRHKYWLIALTILTFIYCGYRLSNATIFFDSERIINDLEINDDAFKLVDDNNLVFVGMSFNKPLSFEDMQKVNEFHNDLKKSHLVKRVFGIINDRRLINTGLFPVAKKIINLDSPQDYVQSVSMLETNPSNFVSDDLKKLLFLVEKEPETTKQENELLVEFLYNAQLNDNLEDVYVSGRLPSELYFSKKVIKEFILLTLISGSLCFLFLMLITRNLALVSFTVLSVIASIVITLGVSQIVFGGIELVMIVTPAILFIVCLSDIMHLTNKQEERCQLPLLFFEKRMEVVGKAVALTSLTTAMSFLTFLANDIMPILRFGIITSFGVVVTLFIAKLVYAISVDRGFNQSKPFDFIELIINKLILFLKRGQSKTVFHVAIFLAIVLGVFGVFNVKIDNYLTDEINKKSFMYAQTAFIDQYFGGIKPITIYVERDELLDTDQLTALKNKLLELGFTVDFSNLSSNTSLLSSMGFSNVALSESYFFVCRTSDEGSLKTMQKLNELESIFPTYTFDYSGAGYLFDLLANDLTKQLIYGLLIAIFSIGLIFFFINKFNINYFIIAIVPNLAPILVCIGVLHSFGFYFSLSNAFIFTIVFGLIIDDSIHVISAYSNHIKRGLTPSKAMNLVLTRTGSAVIKTTFIIIFCLFPLLFSEFKSVSQLSVITILSAVIAVFFDLVYLPLIINRLT